MTDKTDIAALTNERLLEIKSILSGFEDGYDTVDDRENYEAMRGAQLLIDELISLRDQLEAERQRADELGQQLFRAAGDIERIEKHTRGVEKSLVAATDEISALRGEPVRVSMDALRDAVAEMSGGLPLEWQEGTEKGHHGVPFINFNSLHRIVCKLTAPQKPVVLPQPFAVRTGHPFNEGERTAMIPDDKGNWLSKFDVEHAITMSGGFVKGVSDA